MYTGKGAFEMIHAPNYDIEPPSHQIQAKYRVFVQSGSPGNRYLRAGTWLLYRTS